MNKAEISAYRVIGKSLSKAPVGDGFDIRLLKPYYLLTLSTLISNFFDIWDSTSEDRSVALQLIDSLCSCAKQNQISNHLQNDTNADIAFGIAIEQLIRAS